MTKINSTSVSNIQKRNESDKERILYRSISLMLPSSIKKKRAQSIQHTSL